MIPNLVRCMTLIFFALLPNRAHFPGSISLCPLERSEKGKEERDEKKSPDLIHKSRKLCCDRREGSVPTYPFIRYLNFVGGSIDTITNTHTHTHTEHLYTYTRTHVHNTGSNSPLITAAPLIRIQIGGSKR
ncbi:hypothetical protein F4775DRAFT_534688 [Biscogniauxia sp. FL1348]|nr:hypothetical protein F4775DRAFT_534688 [Biscogniauxia sp. FL1348]